MEKWNIIIAYDGTVVIDKTVEAEDRIADMEYIEAREVRRRRWKHRKSILGRFATVHRLN